MASVNWPRAATAASAASATYSPSDLDISRTVGNDLTAAAGRPASGTGPGAHVNRSRATLQPRRGELLPAAAVVLRSRNAAATVCGFPPALRTRDPNSSEASRAPGRRGACIIQAYKHLRMQRLTDADKCVPFAQTREKHAAAPTAAQTSQQASQRGSEGSQHRRTSRGVTRAVPPLSLPPTPPDGGPSPHGAPPSPTCLSIQQRLLTFVRHGSDRRVDVDGKSQRKRVTIYQ